MSKYGLLSVLMVALIVTAGCVYAANSQPTMKKACVAVCSDLCGSECSSGMGYGFGPKGLAIVRPNAAQVKKLQKIHSDFVAATRIARARIQERMRTLSSMWASGKGKAAAINRLIDGIESDRKTLRSTAVDSTFKAMRVLNARQRSELQSSVTNGYVHLLTIGTRMSGGGNARVAKNKDASGCGVACKVAK